MFEHETLCLAVFRHEDDADREAVGRASRRKRPTVDRDGPGRHGIGACDRPHELGPPGPDDAGDTEDFPGPDGKGDVAEGLFRRRQGLDRQDFLTLRRHDGRKHAVERPSDHGLDERLHRHLCGVVAAHPFAIAEHQDAVGDAGDLVEPVADVDETHALAFQAEDLLEQVIRLAAPEGRGRLVEDEEPRLERESLGDLDLLLGRDPQVAHERRRRDVEAESAQMFGRSALHGGSVDPAVSRRKTTDEDVFRDRKIGQEPHLLMNEADAPMQGIGGARGRVRLAVPRHGAFGRGNEPGDDRRHRRFAGPVLAQDRDHLAGSDVEIDVPQDRDRPIALGHAADRQSLRQYGGFGSCHGAFPRRSGPSDAP